MWLVLAALLMPAGLALADWPQFLGPDRTGTVAEAEGLVRSWPAEGPKVLWRVPVGVGFGGPAIYGDSVLILDRTADEQDVLRRIHLTDGTEVWRFSYDAPGKYQYPGSRTTPATDGRLVFCVGPVGHLNAVSFDDASPVWKAHLLDDWEAKVPTCGVAASPLLTDDAIIVAPWGKKAALVAYRKRDGEVMWHTPNHDGIEQGSYVSPVRMALDGQQMIVVSGEFGHVIGADATTGEHLWSYAEYKCELHVPSPTILANQRVLLSGGYQVGAVMLTIQREGDRFIAKEVWKKKCMDNKIAQAHIYNGYIYTNSNLDGGGLRCVTTDGEQVWETGRDPSFEMGNMLIVDGLIFILNGQTGELVMAEANPEGYKELGRAQILDGPKAWAPLAYSDGKLVIRDQKSLVCLDLREGAK